MCCVLSKSRLRAAWTDALLFWVVCILRQTTSTKPNRTRPTPKYYTLNFRNPSLSLPTYHPPTTHLPHIYHPPATNLPSTFHPPTIPRTRTSNIASSEHRWDMNTLLNSVQIIHFCWRGNGFSYKKNISVTNFTLEPRWGGEIRHPPELIFVLTRGGGAEKWRWGVQPPYSLLATSSAIRALTVGTVGTVK